MEKVSLVNCHNFFWYMPLTFNFIASFIVTQLEQLADRGIIMLAIPAGGLFRC